MVLSLVMIPLAYLLGSIPSSVWLGRIFKGIDLREHGSGNAGTSNAFRVLGWRIGIAVLIIDVLKGYLAVNLSVIQDSWTESSEPWMIYRILLGIMSIAGHIFPVFAGFRGGKGVATIAGVGLALHPAATLGALGVYLLVFAVYRISSAASLLAAISFPLFSAFIFKSEYISLVIFSCLVAPVVILTHLSNIRRLLRGEEKAMNRERSFK